MQVTANVATQDGPFGLPPIWDHAIRAWQEWRQSLGRSRFRGATTRTKDENLRGTTSAGDLDLPVAAGQEALAELAALAGSWQDERDVEEIVRDIYDSRTT